MGLPLVISDYRAKHILKRWQVTPVSPSLVLAVEVSMYALYALASLVSLFIAAFCFFGFKMKGSFALFLAGYFLVMLTMFSIGMMAGGVSKNPKTAGIIASLLYFPMLIFSGATLPYEIMPATLQKISDILPLTQGIKILKNSVLGLAPGNVIAPVIVMILITTVCSAITVKFFKWE
ncbi:ABC transporter permease [Treponema sp.]|nr:ABC transporter permease [Treponema sp.]